MRAHILPRRRSLFGCLAVAVLLGACVSLGPGPVVPPSPCGADCKQVTLAMAYTANLSAGVDLGNTPNVDPQQRTTATTAKRIQYALDTVPVLGKGWTTVWGPVVVLKPNLPPPSTSSLPSADLEVVKQVPANTMFMAKKKDANVYVIAIAGTNASSLFDWNDEDLAATPVPWPGTDPSNKIDVTKGTLTGLGILQGMQSGENGPTLYDSLKEIAANPATIYITGHSLGGALAPALGLWLAEKKPDWDPGSKTTLKVYSFAGATPGDQQFAAYVHTLFPGGDGKNDMVIVDNSLDVVPHAFNLQTLQQLDDLYLENPTACGQGSTQLICISPSSKEEEGIKKAIAGAQAAKTFLGVDFATLGQGSQVQGFTGDLKSKDQLVAIAISQDCPLFSLAVLGGADAYAQEAIYQHVCAYSVKLGLPKLNVQMEDCRHKYPNG